MLKTHKQNLVPESDFHIREERVKAAQKTDGGELTSTSKPPPTAPPSLATEKHKSEEKRESAREREEKSVASQPKDEKPQKLPKVKGALTAAEAKAAALMAEKEKQQQKEKEKGEELSKSSESASEAVASTVAASAVSTPNPEPSTVAGTRRDAKEASAVAAAAKKIKTAEKPGKEAENGGNNHSQLKKSDVKTVGESKVAGSDNGSGEGGGGGGGGGKRVTRAIGDNGTEKKPGVKGNSEKTPKTKPKTLTDKSEGVATPGGKTDTPVATSSPATRGAKLVQGSPVVSQNGPTGATPSPSRAGQRRQLSETELIEVAPDKGELYLAIHHSVIFYPHIIMQHMHIYFYIHVCMYMHVHVHV